MKIACDICEKVEDAKDISKKFLSITVNGNSRYLFCEECEKKFWKIFEDAEQLKENKK